jgi:hypothetical protein
MAVVNNQQQQLPQVMHAGPNGVQPEACGEGV